MGIGKGGSRIIAFGSWSGANWRGCEREVRLGPGADTRSVVVGGSLPRSDTVSMNLPLWDFRRAFRGGRAGGVGPGSRGVTRAPGVAGPAQRHLGPAAAVHPPRGPGWRRRGCSSRPTTARSGCTRTATPGTPAATRGTNSRAPAQCPPGTSDNTRRAISSLTPPRRLPNSGRLYAWQRRGSRAVLSCSARGSSW